MRKLVRRARGGAPLGAAGRLEELVGLYGGTDKGEHGYLPHYRRHLGPRRLRRLLVFEIGVGGYDSRAAGGSLAIWRDYLVRSTVVGLDVNDKDIRFGRRVKFVRADQSDPAQLASVVERYGAPGVVIDDGSHIGEHIWASFNFLWPLMPSGSLYVIEDLSTSYYPDFGGDEQPSERTGVGLLKQLVDDNQALDPTFALRPEMGTRPKPTVLDVAAVHVYPGIAFIEKADHVAR